MLGINPAVAEVHRLLGGILDMGDVAGGVVRVAQVLARARRTSYAG